MNPLVLSLFPGLDVLGMGFEAEGFCVVHARDWILGGDVRTFRPPAGRFDGVIGGDPCQSHSALANLVRAKGLEPSFPDLSGEYQRVIEEARPAWFLRENVPRAPDVEPQGYYVRSFLLDHSTLDRGDGTGHEQMRRRRFWFGMRDRIAPDLRRWISFALVCDGSAQSVTGRHEGALRDSRTKDDPSVDFSARYSLDEMLELQGIPPEMLERAPFTMQAKRKLVGNAVPLPMARALARAVKEAMNP